MSASIHSIKTPLGTALLASALMFSGGVQGSTDLTIIGGTAGGGWYMIAGGMSEIIQSEYPELRLRVQEGGGMVNPPRVSVHDADLALSLSVNNEMAWVGAEPYQESYQDMRSIAWGFNPTIYQVVAREEIPVNTFEEIFTERYPAQITSPGLQTMGGWAVTKLMGVYDVTIDEFKDWGGAHHQGGHSYQAGLLRDGQADVLMTLLPLPAPNILEVSSVRELKFLPFSEDLIDTMVNEYGFGRTTIPADAYQDTIPLDADLPSLEIISGLIVNKDVPDDVVYKITKALFENVDRVQKIHRSMQSFVPEEIVAADRRGSTPLHPGARKYYEEVGLIE